MSFLDWLSGWVDRYSRRSLYRRLEVCRDMAYHQGIEDLQLLLRDACLMARNHALRSVQDAN